MSRDTLLLGGGAIFVLALYACYRKGQPLGGVKAVRAGAAQYIDKLADIVSPTCCTGCQAAAQAAAGQATTAAAAAPASSGASTTGATIDPTDPGAGVVA